jgi:multiple sugar transport system permease protein
VLVLSIFPLVVSLYLALSRIRLVQGGFEITFVGLDNFEKLFLGRTQRQFLGRFGEPSLLLQIIFLLIVAALIYWVVRGVLKRINLTGIILRMVTAVITSALIWLALVTNFGGGLPGTLVVTLIFVFGGVTLQYLLGLGLAMLVTQNLPGKRFFRIVFMMPMMITPVGIGFLFRMMTDTLQGPIAPIWVMLGLQDFSWTSTAFGARSAVIIGDTWQWTPFVFIVLLAALEGVPREPVEAALVDGANRWQMFRYIILPQLIPVSTTVILVRMIESFKIIDMPQVLTYGGPGTATESVTLQAYNSWRALDLGGSAAMAYSLLFVVTFVALVFVNYVRRWLLETV